MGQLQQNIQNDLDTTIRSNTEKRELLKTLITEIKLKKGNDASDEDVLAIITKFKSNAIACGNLSEIPYLDLYLPQAMTNEEIYIKVRDIIRENNYTELGKVMQALSKYGPALDKKLASYFAKELLLK